MDRHWSDLTRRDGAPSGAGTLGCTARGMGAPAGAPNQTAIVLLRLRVRFGVGATCPGHSTSS